MAIGLPPNFSISHVSFSLTSEGKSLIKHPILESSWLPAGVSVVTVRVVPHEQAPRDVLQLQQSLRIEDCVLKGEEFGLCPLRDVEVDKSPDFQSIFVTDSVHDVPSVLIQVRD